MSLLLLHDTGVIVHIRFGNLFYLFPKFQIYCDYISPDDNGCFVNALGCLKNVFEGSLI